MKFVTRVLCFHLFHFDVKIFNLYPCDFSVTLLISFQAPLAKVDCDDRVFMAECCIQNFNMGSPTVFSYGVQSIKITGVQRLV